MRIILLAGITLFGLLPRPANAQPDAPWLPRFVQALDSTSVVAERIRELGPDASDEAIIATAAAYFRTRNDPIDLWVIPMSEPATAEDIERADKAVDHVITDRSGSVQFGDHLPWFDAPVKMGTLSRFPHFDYLARAYTSTRDERYAEAMVRDMLDFVEHVPLAKSEAYHVQIAPNVNPWNWVLLQWRVKRWIDALAHLRDSPSLSDADLLRILLYMWDEVDWLEPRKVLGLHNGTLGNISAILYASLHYPEAASAAGWQRDATAFFEAFLDFAFYPKEFSIELTLGYSEGTLLMCLSMFEAMPDSPAKRRISSKLEAIVDAHVGVMKPDRGLPRYGDNGVYDISDRVLRRSARLFGRDDLERLADEPYNPEGLNGRLSFPFHSNPYYLSGYYAMRDGWDVDAQYLSMDAGPFGTNHHHGDKLSITLSADGAPFIVDPGTSLYTSLEPGPRIDLRPGYLHNVITIDGVDPNTGWDRHYGFDVLDNRWVTNPTYDFLEGIYEYRNNLLEIIWRRSVVFIKGDYWIMLDALYGSGEHRVESNMQFMVGNDVSIESDRVEATAPNGASLDIVEALGTGLAPQVVIGDTTFPGTTFLIQYPTFVDWTLGGRGWVGTFGNESPLDPVRSYPAPALLRAGTVQLPFRSVAVMTPSIDRKARKAQVEVLDNTPGGFTLRISSDSSTVDCFHWAPSPWQNHLKKLPKDSGWWSRTVDDHITRVIVMNEDSVSVTSPSETLTLSFDGPFEGVLDRDGDTWIVKPDSYNAVPPKLVRFEMRSGGKARPVEVVRKD
jgi:hypothetical protein